MTNTIESLVAKQDITELRLGDQGRSDLDDRVGPVIEPAEQTPLPESLGKDVLEEPLGR